MDSSTSAPVIPSDRFRPVYAIRPGASGDISLAPNETSNSHVVWSQRSAGTYMPSALVYGDYFYSLYSQGFLTAHDAKAGGEVYGRVRIARGTGGFTSSPWAYNGKIFAMSEDGDTYVIQAGPDYKLLGKNSLGEMVNATPAVLQREPDHSHRLFTVANRENRLTSVHPAGDSCSTQCRAAVDGVI